MKCENCGKNEVSFVYRSSINGKTEEHHLCQACAEKLGYTQKLFARRPSMVDSFFGSDDFFSDFFSQFNWESICIVEFEDILSSDNVLTFFFQVSYNGFCKVLT